MRSRRDNLFIKGNPTDPGKLRAGKSDNSEVRSPFPRTDFHEPVSVFGDSQVEAQTLK